MILKSLDERHSYGPDKLIYGHFWPLTSKCDLDLGDIDVILSRDTLSNDGEHMCQMISKSLDERHSYGPDKLIYGHFWHLTSKCDLDLGDIDVILSRDTLSNDGEHNVPNDFKIPWWDDIVMALTSGTDRQTDRQSDSYIAPLLIDQWYGV